MSFWLFSVRDHRHDLTIYLQDLSFANIKDIWATKRGRRIPYGTHIVVVPRSLQASMSFWFTKRIDWSLNRTASRTNHLWDP